jgi:hypothetical protein
MQVNFSEIEVISITRKMNVLNYEYILGILFYIVKGLDEGFGCTY